MPLAENYISEWNQLFDAISQVSTAELELGALEARIESFVHSHDLFSQQYVQERTVVRLDTDLGVRLSLPNTLKFFYCFVIDFLDNQPELGNQLRQIIEEMDGKAFLLLPHFIILQQIKNKDYPCPEMLEKFMPDLLNLHDLYQNLSKEEQFTLETHLFDESCHLSEPACKVHLKIREIAYRLHENELAQPFTNGFRTLISDLNCDLAIVEKLKMDLETVMIHRTEVNVSELLYALLHVSLGNLELLIPFLPQLRDLKSFAEKFSLSDDSFRNEVKDFLYEI